MDYISKSCCPVTSSLKLPLMDSTPSCEQKTAQGVAECAKITLCQLPQSPHAAGSQEKMASRQFWNNNETPIFLLEYELPMAIRSSHTLSFQGRPVLREKHGGNTSSSVLWALPFFQAAGPQQVWVPSCRETKIFALQVEGHCKNIYRSIKMGSPKQSEAYFLPCWTLL